MVKKINIKQFFSAQFLKYIVVGFLGTALDFSILYALVEYLHLFYLISATVSVCIVIWISFTLNKYWTFQDYSKQYFKQLLKYAISHMIALAVALAVLATLVEIFGMWYIYAKFFATAAAAITNFLIVKSYIFKPSPSVVLKKG